MAWVVMRRFVLALLGVSLSLAGVGAVGARADTFVYLESDQGDYLGLGKPRLLVPEEGIFGTPKVDVTALQIRFDGGTPNWSFSFAAPWILQQPLTVGTYQAPLNPGLDYPLMSISGEGRGCSGNGYFEILELTRDPDGTPTNLAIDFEYHCGGGPAALKGIVRIDSNLIPGFLDVDGDGLIDRTDNCPHASNADQIDTDRDGLGDVCDPYPEDGANLDRCTEDYRALLPCRPALLACQSETADAEDEIASARAGMMEIQRLLSLPPGKRSSDYTCSGRFCDRINAIIGKLIPPVMKQSTKK
jgi:hypothetical protein